jgi:NAD(P)H-hydrate repair Nnr-like enzyme with NAD(P)H-hydrate epimerase domain
MNHTAICIGLQIYVRENHLMKNATKKAAKKAAKKAPAKKKK